MPIILGILISETVHLKGFFRTGIYFPNIVPGLATVWIWSYFFTPGKTGVLNILLSKLGIDPLPWLTNPKWTIPLIVVALTWKGAGSTALIYMANISGISSELYEAATIDGANKIQTLFKVTIPMMMPSITICMFLSITNGFKLFDQNLSLTAGEPSKMSEMMALNIFNTFYGRTGWEGVGQAKAVIFFAIVVVIGMIQLRATRSKEVQQ